MTDQARVCSKCGTEASADVQQCSNPKCRAALRGNKLARKHDAYARVPNPEVRQTAEELQAGIVSDLGGLDNMSALERAYASKLHDTWILASVLAGDLVRHGVLTPGGGKVRAPFDALMTALTVFDRYATRIGLKRRQKHIDPIEALQQAVEEANRA